MSGPGPESRDRTDGNPFKGRILDQSSDLNLERMGWTAVALIHAASPYAI